MSTPNPAHNQRTLERRLAESTLGQLLRTSDVAQLFEVGLDDVTRWTFAGTLASFRSPRGVRRYYRAEVDRLCRRCDAADHAGYSAAMTVDELDDAALYGVRRQVAADTGTEMAPLGEIELEHARAGFARGRRMVRAAAAEALCWIWGRAVHLEMELASVRAELDRVRTEAASRIQAAQIDEADYQRLLELERRVRAAGWATEIEPQLEAKLDHARAMVSELGDGFRVPPPGTFGPGDYGPDSFGGSDF